MKLLQTAEAEPVDSIERMKSLLDSCTNDRERDALLKSCCFFSAFDIGLSRTTYWFRDNGTGSPTLGYKQDWFCRMPCELLGILKQQNWRIERKLYSACQEDDLESFLSAIAIARSAIELKGIGHVTDDLNRHVFAIVLRESAVNILQYWVENGAQVSDVTIESCPKSPSIAAMNVLLAHGWDINSNDALFYVLQDETKVRWFLNNGAAVRSEKTDLLIAAAYSCDMDTFELLVSHGASVDPSQLHIAVFRATVSFGGELEEDWTLRNLEGIKIVEYMIRELKIDPNYLGKARIGAACKLGDTPLHVCARNYVKESNLNVARVLLENGADPHRRNSSGTSAFELAQTRRRTQFLDAVKAYEDRTLRDTTSIAQNSQITRTE